jgi:predicted dehydrogenase
MGAGEPVIRIGMVGAGAVARLRHLPALRAMQGVQLAVVCNRRPESAAAVAEEFGIPEAEADWERVVGRSDIDVVWIGTTPHLHAPIAIAALQAGKHVFCQARMAMNLTEARTMLAAAEAQPRRPVTMLCPPPNGLKHGSYFAQLLRDGIIGRIYHFSFRGLNAQWADTSAAAHWRQRRELSGNNILSVGIYAEVLGRFLGDPIAVCAQGRVCIENRQGYTVTIPDYVQVLGEWPENVSGVLDWSGVARHGGRELLEIYGADGTLIYDFGSDQILLGRAGQDAPVALAVPPEFAQDWTVERDFIRAIREQGRPEPSFRTGVRYMAFTEAVHRSIEEHAWVKLAEL